MIHIAKDFYLGADAYNLILYRARTTKEGPLTKPENVGKVRLSEVGFYNTLDDAINAIFKTVFAEEVAGDELKTFADVAQVVLKCMREVRDNVQSVRELLMNGCGEADAGEVGMPDENS